MISHNRVRNMIHGELCERLKFDDTDKWYIHKPASVLENETPKILKDTEIQTGTNGGDCGVIVMVVRNGHSDKSSNPGRG